ncbi:MAG: hypothetical protein E7523_08075 [Ruminococcaceae bacterium]|nr:hypothetical protein [Oscillospiraceae bacterium]
MKKIISFLLSIVLLFSLPAVCLGIEAKANDEPLVNVNIQGFEGFFEPEGPQHMVFFGVSISDAPNFEKCEMTITISNPSYLFVDDLAEDTDEPVNSAEYYANCRAMAEKIQTGNYQLTLQAEAVEDKYYASFIFLSYETVDFHATIDEVKLYTDSGETENFSVEVSDKINVPVLKAETEKIYMDYYENVEDPERYICTHLSLEKCPSFESFELLITYNPEVLAYTPEYPFWIEDETNSINCTVAEAGKLQVIGTPSESGVVSAFEPICLQVINDGKTDIEITLVSWKDADGEVENGKFYFDFENFYALTCETYQQITAPPTAVLETNGANVWWVPENMTVAQFLATAPTDMVDIFNADEEKLAQDDIIATGCEYKINHPGQFFNIFHLIVKYDLDSDGLVTAADARLALRFAVGLEQAGKDQLYAANVSKSYELTADIARNILRYSVGLPTE